MAGCRKKKLILIESDPTLSPPVKKKKTRQNNSVVGFLKQVEAVSQLVAHSVEAR